MEELKILQEQFQTAVEQFGSMTHLIICSDQVGVLNIKDDYEPNSDKCVDTWTSGDELHYLLRLEGAGWDKEAALRKLKTLAKKGVGWLLDNKDTPGISNIVSATAGLGFGDPVYFWLLAVRHLQSGEVIKITGARGGGRRVAKDNEPFYSVLEDVFLESAFACGTLLGRIEDKYDEGDDSNLEPTEQSATGNVSGMRWQEAQKKAKTIVKEIGFNGFMKLKRAVGCDKKTMRKAIDNSPELTEAETRYNNISSTLKAVGLTDKVLAIYEQSPEGPDPSGTEVDEIIAELLKETERKSPELLEQTKQELERMDPAGRRRLAKTYRGHTILGEPETQRQHKQV